MSIDLGLELLSEGEGDPQEDKEIIVVGRRSGAGSGGGGSGGAGSVVVNRGGTNNPLNSLVETLRGLFDSQTDYDLDTRFTPKQREIILMALQGLANHPVYGPKMAELAAKGADINIIADFTGVFTGSSRGVLAGKNPDGTVDQGESITIYINMSPGGAPVSDISFSETIVHELMHSLGDPGLDAILDASGSTIDQSVRNDIFSGYDFSGAANLDTAQANIVDVPNTGGSSTGSWNYEIFSGSDYADEIRPGAGGSLVYSGSGDDRILIAIDGDIDEIIDTAGFDTIMISAGISTGSISTVGPPTSIISPCSSTVEWKRS